MQRPSDLGVDHAGQKTPTGSGLFECNKLQHLTGVGELKNCHPSSSFVQGHRARMAFRPDYGGQADWAMRHRSALFTFQLSLRPKNPSGYHWLTQPVHWQSPARYLRCECHPGYNNVPLAPN
jgi:hypothetical protein